VKPGAPAVWANCPDNISNIFEVGDKAAVDAAFAKAHHVTRQHFVISRIMHNAIEPRGIVAEYDQRFGRFTLNGCIGSIHGARRAFAEDIFKIPENRFRVVSGDIGGAFGSKGVTAPENTLALYAARNVFSPTIIAATTSPMPSSPSTRTEISSRCASRRSPISAPISARIPICCRPSPTSVRSPASIARRRSM